MMKYFGSCIRLMALSALIFFAGAVHAVAQDPNPGGRGPNYLSDTNPYYLYDQKHGYTLSNPDLVYQCTWYVWGRCADAGWDLNSAPGADNEYSAINNGSGKGSTPAVGAIMCISYTYKDSKGKSQTGYHVAYVYHVDSPTSWEVAQYNVNSLNNGNPLKYSSGTVTRSTGSTTACKGAGFSGFTLVGFIYPPQVQEVNGYTLCAKENQTLPFRAPADLLFGAQSNFNSSFGAVGNIDFNTTTFGDPLIGVPKFGFYKPFIYAGSEGTAIDVSIPVEAFYGVPVSKSGGPVYHHWEGVSGHILFSNDVFGDPAYGIVKQGYYMPYTWCASENHSYFFAVPTDVAYGANGAYVYRYGLTGWVLFSNTQFSDPIQGVVKAGYFRPQHTYLQ